MASQDQRRKAAAQTGLYLLVIVAIAVAANILSAGLYKRVDVTKNERYTLSQGSKRLVAELEKPIQVDAYITRGLPHLNQYARNLTDLLKEYESGSKGKFQFTLIEAKSEEEKEAAKEAGLQEMPFAHVSATGEDSASIAQGFMGLVFSYGKEKGSIPRLDPRRTDGLEFWITNKIREIRDKAENTKHRIGVVTGKDELKLDDKNLVPRSGQQQAPSIKAILSQAFPFYTIEEVDLGEGAKEIDAKLDGLIITQPRKPYTDKELRRIDQFVMLGNKSLVVYASAVTLKPNDATMAATLDTHNLEKLLEGYGIKMNKDAVFDHEGQFRIPMLTQGGVENIGHPGIVHVVEDGDAEEDVRPLDTSFAGFFRMREIVLPYPSSLELLKDKQPKAKVRAVARTTPNATTKTSATVDMKLFSKFDTEGEPKQYVIAAVSEGTLKPALGNGEGIEMKTEAEGSRVLVIASSQFITNPFAYSGNGPEMGGQFAMFGGVGGDKQLQQVAQPYAQRYLTSTIISVKNTLDWMSGDADLLAASAKLMGDANLSYKDAKIEKIKGSDDEDTVKKKGEHNKQAKASLQQSVQWSLTFGVPLFFALFGLFRWRSREARRATVKL